MISLDTLKNRIGEYYLYIPPVNAKSCNINIDDTILPSKIVRVLEIPTESGYGMEHFELKNGMQIPSFSYEGEIFDTLHQAYELMILSIEGIIDDLNSIIKKSDLTYPLEIDMCESYEAILESVIKERKERFETKPEDFL